MKMLITSLLLFSTVIANAGPQEYERLAEADVAAVESAKARVARTCLIDAKAIANKNIEIQALWNSRECVAVRDIMGDVDEHLTTKTITENGKVSLVEYFKIHEIPKNEIIYKRNRTLLEKLQDFQKYSKHPIHGESMYQFESNN